jgi:hypothetical protein
MKVKILSKTKFLAKTFFISIPPIQLLPLFINNIWVDNIIWYDNFIWTE